ncbi:hypothetical protein SLEP1_g10142 [Rubroshorea leprosula]|uniref:RNase H type-1 domain-containing protein n=1 Tax=Rubroshorea leprosula TaxID=152421 RepID=A0AAV5IGL5_9ROSI|nr:hypothetical protein SLEP1_g10142 [Rubroshorea leprosula]
MFSFIIWSLRYFRIQQLHHGKRFNIGLAKEFICSKVIEYQNSFSVQEASHSRTFIDVCWEPPPFDFIKMNTDGAAGTNPGQAGAGDHCGVAFNLLNSDCNNFHPLANLRDDCRALLCQLPKARLHHIYCEANTVADLLAKMGTTLATSVVVVVVVVVFVGAVVSKLPKRQQMERKLHRWQQNEMKGELHQSAVAAECSKLCCKC